MLSGIPDHPPNPLVELLVSGEVIALKPTSQYVHQTRTEGQQLQEQGFRGQMTVIVRATYKVNWCLFITSTLYRQTFQKREINSTLYCYYIKAVVSTWYISMCICFTIRVWAHQQNMLKDFSNLQLIQNGHYIILMEVQPCILGIFVLQIKQEWQVFKIVITNQIKLQYAKSCITI